jgi:hypothetical protein
MERGLRAPLSPHEEISFRRVALGISKAELLPARDVDRLKALSLIKEHESHLRLTPTGRKRYQGLPNIAVPQPEKPDEAASKLAAFIAKARGYRRAADP